MSSDHGALLARGHSASTGAFDLRVHLRMNSSTQRPEDAEAGLVSVPFESFHKMHDLAGSAIKRHYQQQYQQHGQPPSVLSVGRLQQPGANMVMLQV